MIDAIGRIYVMGTVGGSSIPISQSNPPGWQQLKSLKTQLTNALSEHHFIEKNTMGGKK